MDIEGFLKSIKGLSANTRRAYEQTLWLLSSEIKAEEPTKKEIEKFLNHYTTSSLHRHKAAIKTYWGWSKPRDPWPFSSHSFHVSQQKVPRYVSAEVVKEMENLAKNRDDKMFILTLFSLGCRISELLQITPDNVSESGVTVQVKGGRTRLKVLTKDFRGILLKYIQSKKGRVFPRTYTYYYLLLKRLGKQVGHPEVSPHMLRHARAVDLLRKGMQLAFVQQFLGHANINTTAIYLEITGGELSGILEKIDNGNSH